MAELPTKKFIVTILEKLLSKSVAKQVQLLRWTLAVGTKARHWQKASASSCSLNTQTACSAKTIQKFRCPKTRLSYSESSWTHTPACFTDSLTYELHSLRSPKY